MGHIYKISALNIKMHPHEPESYISLLKDASKEKLSAQYYGDRHAMVGFFTLGTGMNLMAHMRDRFFLF